MSDKMNEIIKWQEPRWFYCVSEGDYEWGAYAFIGENEMLMKKEKWAYSPEDIKEYERTETTLESGDNKYKLEEFNGDDLEELHEKVEAMKKVEEVQYELMHQECVQTIKDALRKIKGQYNRIDDRIAVGLMKELCSEWAIFEAAKSTWDYKHYKKKCYAYDILREGSVSIPCHDGEDAPEEIVPLGKIEGFMTMKRNGEGKFFIRYGGQERELKITDELKNMHEALSYAMSVFKN